MHTTPAMRIPFAIRAFENTPHQHPLSPNRNILIVQLTLLESRHPVNLRESVLGAIRAVHGLMQPPRLVDSCLSFTLCLAELMEHHSAMICQEREAKQQLARGHVDWLMQSRGLAWLMQPRGLAESAAWPCCTKEAANTHLLVNARLTI